MSELNPMQHEAQTQTNTEQIARMSENIINMALKNGAGTVGSEIGAQNLAGEGVALDFGLNANGEKQTVSRQEGEDGNMTYTLDRGEGSSTERNIINADTQGNLTAATYSEDGHTGVKNVRHEAAVHLNKARVAVSHARTLESQKVA